MLLGATLDLSWPVMVLVPPMTVSVESETLVYVYNGTANSVRVKPSLDKISLMRMNGVETSGAPHAVSDCAVVLAPDSVRLIGRIPAADWAGFIGCVLRFEQADRPTRATSRSFSLRPTSPYALCLPSLGKGYAFQGRRLLPK